MKVGSTKTERVAIELEPGQYVGGSAIDAYDFKGFPFEDRQVALKKWQDHYPAARLVLITITFDVTVETKTL